MSGEFLGTFTNSVNKQKWVTIPAIFKKKFTPTAKQTVVVSIGPEANIAIYPLDNWKQKIDALRSGDGRAKMLLLNLRTFASHEQKVEANGRVKISDELLEIAQIKDKVIVKGEGNFISVWDPEQYKEFRKKRMQEHMAEFSSLDYQ
ncbi:MAG: protein MraZ [Candidatus Cloacimonadales bacterium]